MLAIYVSSQHFGQKPWTVLLLHLYLKTRSKTKMLMQFINPLYIYVIIQKFQTFNIYFIPFLPSYIYKCTTSDTNTRSLFYNFSSLASIISAYSCDSFCYLWKTSGNHCCINFSVVLTFQLTQHQKKPTNYPFPHRHLHAIVWPSYYYSHFCHTL
jgi:hypothetical protein